jgi:acetyl esterase/lipase
MDQLPPLGRSIWEVIPKTLEIYGSLLSQNSKDAILATDYEVASYGPDTRQNLDIYKSKSSTSPILIFLYGGAWVEGDRVIKDISNGLVYRNLGHYFAAKHGIETIIPDYRLVKHGGKYPSGTEDLALVLAYTRARYGDGRPLFVMGNSAGGVNAVSWLLEDAFTDSRGNSKVTGLISLGSLLDFEGLPAPMPDVLKGYFDEDFVKKSPLAVLRRSSREGTLKETLPALLLLWSELDPEFIIKSNNDFKTELEQNGLQATAVEIKGHNHISPPLALMTGSPAEEEWGASTAEWIKKQSE